MVSKLLSHNLIAQKLVIYQKHKKSEYVDEPSFEQLFSNLVIEHFKYNKSYLSVYDLLGILAECCLYTQENFAIGECLLELIRDLYYPELSQEELANVYWILAGLRYEMFANIASTWTEIGGLHPAFQKDYKKYIPNGVLKKTYSKNRQQPDFIVEIDQIDHPVECKLNFSKKDIEQCLKYKTIWNVDYCFAVAYNFNCAIPSWIKPITILSSSR